MESGTAETSTTAIERRERGANGAPRAEQIDVLNPANGEPVGAIQVDSPETIAATVARVRANQAEWEALGIEGRYHWLGKLRDWLLDNHERDRRHDAGRDRQGPRRHRRPSRSTSPT